jgi:probable phosphoglycerate mutase
MRLLLLRHAESKHSIEKFIAYTACKGLTDRGVEQAERLAQRLKADFANCDVLLSTSVKRAHKTASIISTHLNKPIQINDELCEQRPGDADGMLWTQYREKYDSLDPVANPDTPLSPNGETWNQFLQRVGTALDTLQQNYVSKNVIAVTHAGFIVASFLLLFDAPFSGKRAWLNPDFTSITEWVVSDEVWRLARYNDTTHLHSLPQH